MQGLPVEFADLDALLLLAEKKQTTYINLAKRFVKVGLRTVYIEDDAMLIRTKYKELWNALHEVGIRTAFKLRLEATWEKSLSKLSKLKKIQEKSSGISYIEIPQPVDVDTIRFACITRLFLDNIHNITVAVDGRSLQSELALTAGVNEIILER